MTLCRTKSKFRIRPWFPVYLTLENARILHLIWTLGASSSDLWFYTPEGSEVHIILLTWGPEFNLFLKIIPPWHWAHAIFFYYFLLSFLFPLPALDSQKSSQCGRCQRFERLISHLEAMVFCFCFFTPSSHLLSISSTWQSLSSINIQAHPLRVSHWARHCSLQGLLQHISGEIRTDLLGGWCPTNHEYVVNQLYSISHSKAKKAGFHSTMKARER